MVSGRAPRWALAAAGLWAVSFGLKLPAVDATGSYLPKADEVVIEAPIVKGHATARWDFSRLTRPSGQHRVLPQKLLAWAVYGANGRWDRRLLLTLHTLLAALAAAAFWRLLAPPLATAERLALAIATVALLGSPLGWIALQWGAMLHLYIGWLAAFALFWGLAPHDAGTPRWWLGIAGGALGLANNGAGLLAAGCVLIVGLGSRLASRDRGRRFALWITGAGGLLLIGWLTRPERIQLRPRRPLASILDSVSAYLAWPLPPKPLTLVLMLCLYGPLLVLGLGLVRKTIAGRPWSPAERILAGVGSLAIVTVLAVAWSRGGGPYGRHAPFLALAWAASAAVVLTYAGRWRTTWRRPLIGGALAMALVPAILAGSASVGGFERRADDRFTRIRHQAWRHYVATAGTDPDGNRYYRGYRKMRFALNDEALRPWMPFQFEMDFVAPRFEPARSWFEAAGRQGVRVGRLTPWNDRLLHRSWWVLALLLPAGTAAFWIGYRGDGGVEPADNLRLETEY